MKMTKNEVYNWLFQYNINDFYVKKDLTVDVLGSVDISSQSLIEIPIQFGEVSGNFNCDNNLLTSFQGMPTEIGLALYASNNLISSFEGFPKYIGTSARLLSNEITHLIKLDTKIEKNLYLDYNSIKSLNDFNGGFGRFLIHNVENELKMIEELMPYYTDFDNNLYQLKVDISEFKDILLHLELNKKINKNPVGLSKKKKV